MKKLNLAMLAGLAACAGGDSSETLSNSKAGFEVVRDTGEVPYSVYQTDLHAFP